MKNSTHLFSHLLQRLKRSPRRRRPVIATANAEPLETRILPATITVTSLADNVVNDDHVTLREAIQAADTDTSVNGSVAGDGADIIQFAPGLTGTILLNGTHLEIMSEITILGPSQHELIINGNNRSRVIQTWSSAVVSIDGVTIRNGSDSEGGGIQNNGNMTISNSTIRSNFATLDGGGIDNFGTLTLKSTAVHNNTSAGYGGGIYNWGTLNIDRSSIYANVADNEGGAIADTGTLSIANTTISLNATEFGSGGGIQSDGGMTLVNSTLVGNRAARDATGDGTGGGIAVLSTIVFTMHNTVVANNYSGDSAALVSSDIATPPDSDVVNPISSNNLVSVDAGFDGISNGSNGNQIGTIAARLDPKLSGLLLNAGHYSHSPLTDSPLINAGSDLVAHDSFGASSQFDQSGIARQSTTVDIGSIEVDSQVTVVFNGTRHVVLVEGTNGTDLVTLVPNSAPRITLNGVNYKFDNDRLINPLFQIIGLDGPDQLRVNLSAADDSVTLRPQQVEIDGAAFDVVGTSFHSITVDGAGGHDTVVFEDSQTDDAFVGKRDVAWISGSGFNSTARNFEDVTATSTSGNDTAQLSTSNGLAQFVATPSQVNFNTDISSYKLTSFVETDTWLLGTINAASRADFFDSSGNEVFEATPVAATLRGTGFDHTVFNSPVSRAHGTAGGTDTAYFHDSAGDDIFVVKPEFGLMIPAAGNAYYNYARGFDTVIGYASTGHDSVQLYDSTARDTLVSTENYVVLRSTVYYAQANGFDVRDVYSVRGGNDVAQFVDSSGDNHFVAQGSTATISDSDGSASSLPNWKTSAFGFASVVAIGNNGGQNQLDWTGPLSYAFRHVGSWNIN